MDTERDHAVTVAVAEILARAMKAVGELCSPLFVDYAMEIMELELSADDESTALHRLCEVLRMQRRNQ